MAKNIMKKKVFSYVLLISLLILFTSCTQDAIKPEIFKNAVVDYDGNTYDAVKIGNQVWMASNLRVTHFSNGNEIPIIVRDDYYEIHEPSRYFPNDNSDLVDQNGLLYNWYAAVDGDISSASNPSGIKGICPEGWHLPSRAEWIELVEFLGSHEEYCTGGTSNIAKSLAATSGWNYSSHDNAVGNNQSENNQTAFNAIPVGCYRGDHTAYMGDFALFWTCEEAGISKAYEFIIRASQPTVIMPDETKSVGLSVRCVRD